MATHGWGTDHSVKEFLYEQAHRFEFYQAVKILEILYPGAVSVGVNPDPGREAVRFLHRVSMGFPPADVDSLAPGVQGGPDQLTVNFMGLAGANSPLPASYTELILQRLAHKDRSLKEFLDIFNHRLVSLMYRIRKKYHIGFDFKPPSSDHVSEFLFDLIGLGTPGLHGRMGVKDRALLFYAGLFNQQPHSMAGLEGILAHYFGFRISGQHYIGQWYKLEPDQWTHIGRTGQNQVLGRNAVLGTRVWDRQGKFRLHIGPLDLERFVDCLPIGKGYVPLCELTRFYAGQEFDFDFRLTLRAAEVPESRLGGKIGPRLGWTSWLKTRDFTRDDSQVRLTLHSGYYISRHDEDLRL